MVIINRYLKLDSKIANKSTWRGFRVIFYELVR